MFKRITFFAYGSISYLIFLGTFLYAIGFIGNFGVPTTLDGAPQWTTRSCLRYRCGFVDAVCGAAQRHGAQVVQGMVDSHCAEADRTIHLRPVFESRSDPVVLAVAAVGWRGVVHRRPDSDGSVLRGLFAFGWALVLVSTFLINHFDLFGLRQVWLYLRGRPYTTLQFGTPGPYRLVRHPLYVGWLFAFWSTPTMTLAHLLFSVATTAYILIAIQLEERDLIREHGESYEAYRRSVPMLIPFTRRHRDSELAERISMRTQ